MVTFHLPTAQSWNSWCVKNCSSPKGHNPSFQCLCQLALTVNTPALRPASISCSWSPTMTISCNLQLKRVWILIRPSGSGFLVVTQSPEITCSKYWVRFKCCRIREAITHQKVSVNKYVNRNLRCGECSAAGRVTEPGRKLPPTPRTWCPSKVAFGQKSKSETCLKQTISLH